LLFDLRGIYIIEISIEFYADVSDKTGGGMTELNDGRSPGLF